MFGNPLDRFQPAAPITPAQTPTAPAFRTWADEQIAKMSGGTAKTWDDLDTAFAAVPTEPGKEPKDHAGAVRKQLVDTYTANVLPQFYQEPKALAQAKAYAEANLAPYVIGAAFKPLQALAAKPTEDSKMAALQESYNGLLSGADDAAKKARAGIGLDKMTRMNGEKYLTDLGLKGIDPSIAEARIQQEQDLRVAESATIEQQYATGQIDPATAQKRLDALYREHQNLDGARNVLLDSNDFLAAGAYAVGGVGKGLLAIPEMLARTYSGTVSGLSGESFGSGWNDPNSTGAKIGVAADGINQWTRSFSEHDEDQIASQYVMQAYKDSSFADATSVLADNPGAAYAMIVTAGPDSIAQFVTGGTIGKGLAVGSSALVNGTRAATGAALGSVPKAIGGATIMDGSRVIPKLLTEAKTLGQIKDVYVGAAKAAARSGTGAAGFKWGGIGIQANAAGLADGREVGRHMREQLDSMGTDKFLSLEDVQAERDIWRKMDGARLDTYIANKKAEIVGSAMASTTAINTAALTATGYAGSKIGLDKFLIRKFGGSTGRTGSAASTEAAGTAQVGVGKGVAFQAAVGGSIEAGEEVIETGVQHIITNTYLDRDMSARTPFDNYAGAAMSGLIVGGPMDAVGGYFEIRHTNAVAAENAVAAAAEATATAEAESAATEAVAEAARAARLESEASPRGWAGAASVSADGSLNTAPVRFTDEELRTEEVQQRVDKAFTLFNQDDDPYSVESILTDPNGMGLDSKTLSDLKYMHKIATDPNETDTVMQYRAKTELLRLTNTIRLQREGRKTQETTERALGYDRSRMPPEARRRVDGLLPPLDPVPMSTDLVPVDGTYREQSSGVAYQDPLADVTVGRAPKYPLAPRNPNGTDMADTTDPELVYSEVVPGTEHWGEYEMAVYEDWYYDMHEIHTLNQPASMRPVQARDPNGTDMTPPIPVVDAEFYPPTPRQLAAPERAETYPLGMDIPPRRDDPSDPVMSPRGTPPRGPSGGNGAAFMEAYRTREQQFDDLMDAAYVQQAIKQQQEAQQPPAPKATQLKESRTAVALAAGIPSADAATTLASTVSEDGDIGLQVVAYQDGAIGVIMSGKNDDVVRVHTVDVSKVVDATLIHTGDSDPLAAVQLALNAVTNRARKAGGKISTKVVVPAVRLAIARQVLKRVDPTAVEAMPTAQRKQAQANILFLKRTIEEDKARVVGGRSLVQLEYVTGVRDVLPDTHAGFKDMLADARLRWHKLDGLLRGTGHYHRLDAGGKAAGVGKAEPKPREAVIQDATQKDAEETASLAMNEAADHIASGGTIDVEQAQEILTADAVATTGEGADTERVIKDAINAYEKDRRYLAWRALKEREDATLRNGEALPARTAAERVASNWVKKERSRIAKMQTDMLRSMPDMAVVSPADIAASAQGSTAADELVDTTTPVAPTTTTTDVLAGKAAAPVATAHETLNALMDKRDILHSDVRALVGQRERHTQNLAEVSSWRKTKRVKETIAVEEAAIAEIDQEIAPLDASIKALDATIREHSIRMHDAFAIERTTFPEGTLVERQARPGVYTATLTDGTTVDVTYEVDYNIGEGYFWRMPASEYAHPAYISANVLLGLTKREAMRTLPKSLKAYAKYKRDGAAKNSVQSENPADVVKRLALAARDGLGSPAFDEYVSQSLEDAPITAETVRVLNEKMDGC